MDLNHKWKGIFLEISKIFLMDEDRIKDKDVVWVKYYEEEQVIMLNLEKKKNKSIKD